MIKKNKKKGFTLIELVIVIAILAILAAILIPSISGYVNKANDARNQANGRSVYMAATLAVSENEDTEKQKAAASSLSDTKVSEIKTDDSGNVTSVTYSIGDKSYTVTITNGQPAVTENK